MADVSASFSADEWTLLSNALTEILHGPEAIEEWEFQTRTGVPREKAKALLRRMAEQS